MNNLNIQLQSIKSQIDNMKLQIINIEMQSNNINAFLNGEQLMNLGIQMFNTGLNSFNIGKSISASSFDNYYIQLKYISEQISNIIKTYEYSIQQMQMMFQQNQLMKEQMINRNNVNIQLNNQAKIMNLTFENEYNRLNVINIICIYGTKIREALEMFSNRMGKNKNQFKFFYKLNYLDYNDDRKIEDVFSDLSIIKFNEK